MNAHSRGLHREHARPGQPIFLSGRRRHGASTFFLGVAGMARPLSLSLAGRARNTDGTHPRASSGARSVVSGPFPEASVAGMAASLICLRPARPYGAELVSTWEASGAAACRLSQPSPRRPSFRRPAVSPWHPLNPFSSVPMVSESSAVWAGWSRSPRQTLRHGAVVALAPLASLIFGPVVKEEPAASSTS